VSSRTQTLNATVTLRFISIETGRDVRPKIEKEVQVAANGTTDVLEGTINNAFEEPHVLPQVSLSMASLYLGMWIGPSPINICRLLIAAWW